MYKRVLFAALVAAAAVVCLPGPARATVTSDTTSVTYAGNGATTKFTVPFKFLKTTDLAVTVNSVTKALTTDYTVAGAGNATGSVTFLAAPASGALVVITRDVDYLQSTSIANNRSFQPDVVEGMIDKAAMGLQQLNAQLGGGSAATQSYVDAAINATLTGGTVVSPITWSLTGDGSTTQFAIANAVVNAPELYQVTIDGLVQKPTTDYTVSTASGQITFTTAPSYAAAIVVRSLGYAKATSVGDSTSVLATGTTVPRPLKDWLGDTKNAIAFGADNAGATDSSSAVLSAIAALPNVASSSGGGTVYFPPGTYLVNVTVAAKFNVRFVGAGRRATILKPFTNAPVLKFDSTSGAMQGATVENMGFVAANGTTSPAILITGNNINDNVSISRFYISGFSKGISITGRCIWCRFSDGEILSDQSNGFDVTVSAGTQPVNALVVDQVSVRQAAAIGFNINNTDGANTISALDFRNVNPEGNGSYGMVLNNADNVNVSASYFESNTTAHLLISGAFCRGISVTGSRFWLTTATAWSNTCTRVNAFFGGNMVSGATTNFNLNTAGDTTNNSIVLAGNWLNSAAAGVTSGGRVSILEAPASGTAALTTGSATVALPVGGYRACVCTDNTAANACKTALSGTNNVTLTLTGTGSDTLAYHCF